MVLSALPALSLPGFAAGESAEDGTPAEDETSEGTGYEVGSLDKILNADKYTAFLEKHVMTPAGSAPIPVDVTDYDEESTTAEDVKVLPSYEGEQDVIFLPEKGAVGWKIEAPSTGMYTVDVVYYAGTDGKKTSIERTVYIDGEIPYYESIYLSLPKTYENQYVGSEEEGLFNTDINGNELRPEAELRGAWREYVFSDATGYYIEPLTFYLTKGEHTFQLYSQRESMYLSSMEFVPLNPNDTEKSYYTSYEDYLADWKSKGAKEVTLEEPIRHEAEYSYQTSEITIYPSNDRSSPISSPQHPSQQKMNTLGGGTEKKWNTVGQWVSYKLDVPQTGLYKIAIRFNQNESDGAFVSRRLRVRLPGERFATVPFKEAAFLQFNYEDDWQVEYLNNGSTVFEIYLEKGENVIELEANLGGMAELIRQVNESMTAINDAYIKIIMLAGTDPDENRDYGFYARIPEAVDELLLQSTNLQNIADNMVEVTGTRGTQITTLETISQLLYKMGRDESEIAGNLSTLKSYLGNLGTWISDARKSPLEVDFIELHSGTDSDEQLPPAEASFWQKMSFEFRTFIASFTTDYNTLGALTEVDTEESLQVWISLGRDQAQIVREQVANKFTPEYGVSVDLKLVAAGSLLPSVLAGVGPDVSMGHATSDVINWAIRNALVELTDFVEQDGYLTDKNGNRVIDEPVYDWFAEAAWVPLRLQEVITRETYEELSPEEQSRYTTDYTPTAEGDNGYAQKTSIWGVPQEQTFNMMFYRADIFLQLGLEPPQTWEDLYYIIGVLQSNNMEIALPTSLAGLEMFLYQMTDENGNPGDLYQNGGQQISLNSNVTLSAFESLCDFFQQYRFPISYSFDNRFRTGEIPLGIVPYTSYTQLAIYATEIKGLWEFVPLPGTVNYDAEGNVIGVNNDSVSGTSAMIMLRDASEREKTKEAWTFMKWFVSADTQSSYASDLTAVLGTEYKYNTANRTALEELPWTDAEASNLEAQFENLAAVKEYPGSYIIARYVDFSFMDVYNDNMDPVEALLEYVVAINSEITRKREEFGLATMDTSYSGDDTAEGEVNSASTE